MARTTHNGGEDCTWCVVSGKPGLAHACNKTEHYLFQKSKKWPYTEEECSEVQCQLICHCIFFSLQVDTAVVDMEIEYEKKTMLMCCRWSLLHPPSLG